MANWTDLPIDLLVVIAENLPSIEDFSTFSSVCKEWQSATTILKKKPSLPTRYPRIMLPEKLDTNGQGNQDNRCFLNLLTSKTYELKLPEASGRKCVGAHYGWLLTVGSDLQINLLHPFSRQQICLPPMLTFPDQYEYDDEFTPQDVYDLFVRKIVMSSNPCKETNNHDCVIMAIYGEYEVLAFARLGDKVWTNITVPSRCYEDIVYYNGKFYAVDCHGVVVVCDLDDTNGPKATVVAPAPSGTFDWIQKYLVESSGHLLLVSRTRGGLLYENVLHDEEEEDDNEDNNEVDEEEEKDGENDKVDDDDEEDDEENDKVDDDVEQDDDGDNDDKEEDDDNVEQDNDDDNDNEEPSYYTIGFSVLKLEECQEKGNDCAYRLNEVPTLGDQALFLGNNVSISLSSSNCIKANCIYFSEDNYELYSTERGGGGYDTGIFNLEDGTIQLNYAGESRSCLAPPLWYI
ncbi:F-box protein SKIP23 [Abeliophyllum distichum]|uniref:F-box protein SKIP23 n=1 Tax=Abeliophyllum distichum TaxID=126358 RepID=A0ABD1VTK1_9LAMI